MCNVRLILHRINTLKEPRLTERNANLFILSMLIEFAAWRVLDSVPWDINVHRKITSLLSNYYHFIFTFNLSYHSLQLDIIEENLRDNK